MSDNFTKEFVDREIEYLEQMEAKAKAASSFAAPTGLEARHTTTTKMKTGTELIADERARQINSEGWTPAHDDEHEHGQMLDAGLSYLRAAINVGHPAMQNPPREWPWEAQWWKPAADRTRNLVKAGALIAAEIDRLQRASNNQTLATASEPRPTP